MQAIVATMIAIASNPNTPITPEKNNQTAAGSGTGVRTLGSWAPIIVTLV
ncbi:MAG TPA: hypothetical protein VGH12_06155 [Steroidobacteraceae bacterium]